MGQPFLLLDNPVQDYAWGSRTAIADFLGRPNPEGKPEAELWIGAHPRAPSRLAQGPGSGTLDRVIQDDPVGLLGPEVCERFGNELPFLLKVLAAAEPLSIQAHPDQEQARRGWARENAEGVPLEAPHRNYRDPNHKPELVCALGPFTALRGFRPFDEIARNLEPIALPELRAEISRLARERSPAALRSLFARLMTLDPEEKRPVLDRALTEARRRAAAHADWDWVLRLQRRYPSDVGILSPLYLNLLVLAPEEGLYLPAGELHTYLEGTALEVMANSDNVLRGGLTPKHVDVPELLSTLAFEAHPPEILRPVEEAPGERVYRTPAREFELAILRAEPGRAYSSGPNRGVGILLGLAGEPVLEAAGQRAALGRGRSLFLPASTPSYVIEGDGRVCSARVPA